MKVTFIHEASTSPIMKDGLFMYMECIFVVVVAIHMRDDCFVGSLECIMHLNTIHWLRVHGYVYLLTRLNGACRVDFKFVVKRGRTGEPSYFKL
eukprot:scaffold215414_cov63-Attheya_sp.AAC.1